MLLWGELKGAVPKQFVNKVRSPYMGKKGGFGTRPYGLSVVMFDFWDGSFDF